MELSLGTRRICDWCNHHFDFPAGNFKPQDLKEISSWVGTVGFTVIDDGSDDTNLQPYLHHFCKKECAIQFLAEAVRKDE